MSPDDMIERLFGRRWKKNKKAFTLIEVLISVSIIGVLGGVTIQAISPRKNILSAFDSKRIQHARQAENAMFQYLIDNAMLPNESQMLEGKANAKPICQRGIVDSSCVNLDPLLVPSYFAYLPTDELEPCALYTGYKTYKESGRPRVFSNYLGKLPNDVIPSEICGNPTPPVLTPLDVRDDGVWGYSSVGIWNLGSTPEGYLSDYRVRQWSDESSDGYAAMVLAGATVDQQYEFFVSWVPLADAATNVSYEIYFGSPSTLQATVVKNQRIAPNDGQYGGAVWESLGTYTVTTFGTTVRVLNTSGNDGKVIADGFMFVPR
jgi:prepilin-type N-terminal cleavage/methylation domain-containing protein